MNNTETIKFRESTNMDETFAYIGKTKENLGILQKKINQSEQKETTEDPELRKLTELFLNVLGGDISKKDALIQQIIKTYCSFHWMKEKDFPKGIKSNLEKKN